MQLFKIRMLQTLTLTPNVRSDYFKIRSADKSKNMDYSLLEELCSIPAPSGSEGPMKDFLLTYIEENKKYWKVTPQIIEGELFQDCILLVFGQPKTAVFTHIDSIGFTVRYDNKLIPIGGPEALTGYELVGEDSKGKIETKLVAELEEGILCCDFQRAIERGTELVFRSNHRENEEYVQNCYLDNRLGVFVSLKLAETLENGVIAFSCFEEHGGGTVPFLVKWIWEKYKISQYLVCDITWATEGVELGNGVAISLRDSRIPRKKYLKKILDLANKSGVRYQLEVEGSGGSDGRELQASPYPVDWVFIGVPEEGVHTPDEKANKGDINEMLKLYEFLMKHL